MTLEEIAPRSEPLVELLLALRLRGRGIADDVGFVVAALSGTDDVDVEAALGSVSSATSWPTSTGCSDSLVSCLAGLVATEAGSLRR